MQADVSHAVKLALRSSQRLCLLLRLLPTCPGLPHTRPLLSKCAQICFPSAQLRACCSGHRPFCQALQRGLPSRAATKPMSISLQIDLEDHFPECILLVGKSLRPLSSLSSIQMLNDLSRIMLGQALAQLLCSLPIPGQDIQWNQNIVSTGCSQRLRNRRQAAKVINMQLV